MIKSTEDKSTKDKSTEDKASSITKQKDFKYNFTKQHPILKIKDGECSTVKIDEDGTLVLK